MNSQNTEMFSSFQKTRFKYIEHDEMVFTNTFIKFCSDTHNTQILQFSSDGRNVELIDFCFYSF